MTCEEIFSAIVGHLRAGIEMHRNMMLAYSFLSLQGYKKCQEYHWLEETNNCQKIIDYYMDAYYKLVNAETQEVPYVMPQTWYKYTQMDVDNNTRRNTIKEMTKQWVLWETETKAFLEKQYKELIAINEVAAAAYLQNFIIEVSNELQQASHIMVQLETINYDIIEIVKEQNDYFNEYEKKLQVGGKV